MSSVDPESKLKSRRITRACDFCHRRAIRCIRDQNAARCHNCAQYDQPCNYTRQLKKRGTKPGSKGAPNAAISTTPDIERDSVSRPTWTAHPIASQTVVMSLAEVYFEIVYPIFPLFHQPTYLRRISHGEHNTDRHLFGTTMALCALVSARVRDQALSNTSYDMNKLTQVPSAVFYEAAVQACADVNPRTAQNFESLRTCALLALTAVQHNNIREMQGYLGKYHTLVAMDGLQDEANWTAMGIVETEERRRLFWSMYTLEIYVSVVWNGMTRVREQQINVSYPTELDDELFNDRGYFPSISSPSNTRPSPGSRRSEIQSNSWLCGWNFTTDLYRVLEHVISNFRDRRRHKGSFPTDMFVDSAKSVSSVRDSVMQLYINLPQCFKEVSHFTCDPKSDRYGFQAANITATIQLLQMMLFASGGGTVEERCRTASEMIDAFTQIPVTYLRAISSPLLHHLAGIGSILGNVFEEPLNEEAHQLVRVVLLALAQLLENLEHGVYSTKSAQRLRDLVARIDDYMRNQRDQSGIIPPQLTTENFEEWPCNLDFMQLLDSWTSAYTDPSR